MSECSSPINRATRWSREQGLSPGARSNPSRGDTSQLGNMPSVPKDEGTPPEPSQQQARQDAVAAGQVAAHLHKHACLRIERSELPPGLAAFLK
jgi:hypothetical protein